MTNSKKLSVREICQISVFVTIIVFCAQLSIPLPGGIPLTFQTFGIALAGIVLGAKNATLAAVVYILLGAAGAPVFANFAGGLHHIFGPTGGFILSFPAIAFFAGVGGTKENIISQVSWLTIGVALNSICGMLFFSLQTSLSLPAAFTAAVLPFIPMDIIRIIILSLAGRRIKQALIKSGLYKPQ